MSTTTRPANTRSEPESYLAVWVVGVLLGVGAGLVLHLFAGTLLTVVVAAGVASVATIGAIRGGEGQEETEDE